MCVSTWILRCGGPFDNKNLNTSVVFCHNQIFIEVNTSAAGGKFLSPTITVVSLVCYELEVKIADFQLQ